MKVRCASEELSEVVRLCITAMFEVRIVPSCVEVCARGEEQPVLAYSKAASVKIMSRRHATRTGWEDILMEAAVV